MANVVAAGLLGGPGGLAAVGFVASQDSGDDLLSSVSANLLADQGVVLDELGQPPEGAVLISREKAEAAAGKRGGDAALKEAKLVLYGGTGSPDHSPGERRPAWIFSFAIVPPFQGPPPPEEEGTYSFAPNALTVDNTYFLVVIDARTGERITVIGGTLGPFTEPTFHPAPERSE